MGGRPPAELAPLSWRAIAIAGARQLSLDEFVYQMTNTNRLIRHFLIDIAIGGTFAG